MDNELIIKKTVTELTRDSVSILTQEFTSEISEEIKDGEKVEVTRELQVGLNHRCGYNNSEFGRTLLINNEPEDIVTEVLVVWGEEPIVEDLDLSNHVRKPTVEERVSNLESEGTMIEDELLSTQLALTEQYEANIVLEEELLNTQLALTEQYETNITMEEMMSNMQKEIEELKAKLA